MSIYTVVDDLRSLADRIQYYKDPSLTLEEIKELANEFERGSQGDNEKYCLRCEYIDCLSDHTGEEPEETEQ